MDGTPYPPPAPQVPPTPAPPQPQYAPPAPQPAYEQQQYQQPPYAEPQPPKKKTGLIIGIVVGVLLLCCIGSAVAGYLIYKAAADEVSNTLDTSDESSTDNTLDLNADTTEDVTASTIDTGWESFQPSVTPGNGYGALESFHQEVLDEAAATLLPDFEVQEALARPSAEYTTDTVVARATLADDPSVQIAFYLEVENTEAFDSGWTNDTANEEYDYLDYGVAANGREYFWDNTQLVPLLGGISDPAVTDLLVQAATDFPGGVIYWIEIDGSTGYIEVTRWEAYQDYSAGFTADYTLDGDTWVLQSAEQW